MSDFMDQLAVQSFCFRHFKDNAEVAELVKKIGLSRIELCRIHVDFDDTASHQKVIDTYKNAGVTIVSAGVEPADDAQKFKNVLEFAKAAQLTHVSVNFDIAHLPQNVHQAHQLAEQYNIKLGIHNHGGYHWLGNKQALSHVLGISGPRLGLCLDTAWALDAKHDPIDMIQTYKDKLFAIHLKDFTFDRARMHTDVPVGQGNLDLKAIKANLQEIGFKGLAILEYEGDPEDPEPALKACVDAMRQAMG